MIRPKDIDVARHVQYGVSSPFEDTDTVRLTVENAGPRAIAPLFAAISLENDGGNVLYSGTLEEPSTIPPGRMQEVEIHLTGIEPNFNPTLMRETSVQQAVIRYNVSKIIYADGSTIARDDLSQLDTRRLSFNATIGDKRYAAGSEK